MHFKEVIVRGLFLGPENKKEQLPIVSEAVFPPTSLWHSADPNSERSCISDPVSLRGSAVPRSFRSCLTQRCRYRHTGSEFQLSHLRPESGLDSGQRWTGWEKVLRKKFSQILSPFAYGVWE